MGKRWFFCNLGGIRDLEISGKYNSALDKIIGDGYSSNNLFIYMVYVQRLR